MEFAGHDLLRLLIGGLTLVFSASLFLVGCKGANKIEKKVKLVNEKQKIVKTVEVPSKIESSNPVTSSFKVEKKQDEPQKPPLPQKPQTGGMANTQDPNYQTLAGLGTDCFDKTSGAPPTLAAPVNKAIAGTHDPNYQTLAGLQPDCFGPDKKGITPTATKPSSGAVPGGPKPTTPANKAAMAGTHDPNYQTLAGLQPDCFGPDKKGTTPAAKPVFGGTPGGPKPATPANKAAIAGTHDPNYQTLAGLQPDCFGPDKKGTTPAAKPVFGGTPGGPKPTTPANNAAMAGTHDPNYQTLAGLQPDCFGPDKRLVTTPAKPTTPVAPKGPAAPLNKNVVAATRDPNYQMLVGLNQDIFGADKKAVTPAKPTTPAQTPAKPITPAQTPARPIITPAQTPAKPIITPAQTPANPPATPFKTPTTPGAPKAPVAPVNKNAVAATRDPNYQTLAGLNQNIFGGDKKAATPAKPPAAPVNKAAIAGTQDPNYQTLAGLNSDVFGADKKK